LTNVLFSYPYFQGSSIGDAANVFWKSVQDTKNAVDRVSPGKWVWVTETGWPVSGANFGAGVASVKNARKLKHTQSVQTNESSNPPNRDILEIGGLPGF
jgi:exo-beta-1,3-glucanase (GH17 family)